MGSIKSHQEISHMRESGRLLRLAQNAVKSAIKAGTTLLELDRIAEECIRKNGGIPAFKGYHGFPATICTMLNSEVVHGIPDNRTLSDGDLLSVDCGVVYKNLYSDAAFTVIVGGDEKNPERARFSQTVKKALLAGCEKAVDGNCLGDIGSAIQKIVESAGFSVVKEFTGHGIGYVMHEDPFVLNYGVPGKGERIKAGMTLCIEPIIAMGKPKTRTLKDNWTVVTIDGSDACQWEHCGLVTKTGFEIFA